MIIFRFADSQWLDHYCLPTSTQKCDNSLRLLQSRRSSFKNICLELFHKIFNLKILPFCFGKLFVLYKLPFWIVNSCEVLVEIRWWWCPSTRWASGGRTRRATLSLFQLMRSSQTLYSAREGATNFQKELLCFWFYQTRAEWWGHRWIVQTWGHPGGKPMVVTGHHCDHNDCHHHNRCRHCFKE